AVSAAGPRNPWVDGVPPDQLGLCAAHHFPFGRALAVFVDGVGVGGVRTILRIRGAPLQRGCEEDGADRKHLDTHDSLLGGLFVSPSGGSVGPSKTIWERRSGASVCRGADAACRAGPWLVLRGPSRCVAAPTLRIQALTPRGSALLRTQ